MKKHDMVGMRLQLCWLDFLSKYKLIYKSMKYIKMFEYNEDKPKVVDYVICLHGVSKEETKFLQGKIG